MTFFRLLVVTVALSLTAQTGAKEYSVRDYVRYSEFHQVKISPTGEYIAITQQIDRRVRLIVMRMSDLAKIGLIQGNVREQIRDFHWANDERLVLQMSEVDNYRATPRSLGQIYAANYDGSNARVIFGIDSASENIGTYRQSGKVAAGQIVDMLDDDPDHILISSHGLNTSAKRRMHRPQIYKVNINTGRRKSGMRAPMTNGQFIADESGEIRFFSGTIAGFDTTTYRRAG